MSGSYFSFRCWMIALRSAEAWGLRVRSRRFEREYVDTLRWLDAAIGGTGGDNDSAIRDHKRDRPFAALEPRTWFHDRAKGVRDSRFP